MSTSLESPLSGNPLAESPGLQRVGACCGVLFAVVLFVAAGDGSHGYSGPRLIAAVVAITLALPFLAHLSSLLRRSGQAGWTAPAVLAGGVAGVTLKLASEVPTIAAHRVGHPTSQLTDLTDGLAGAATIVCLDAFALCCASVAIGGLVSHALPRWVCVGAAVIAVALVVNGAFLDTELVPAFLLFNVWSFATSIHVLLHAGRVVRVPALLAAGTSARDM